MKQQRLPASAKIGGVHGRARPGGPEPNLWDRDALPIARDCLFVAAILFYVIGFAYQSAKMRRFSMSVDLGDQQLSSLLSWAFEAIGNGLIAYSSLVCGVLALVVLAAYLKHRLRERPYCRTAVRALITASATLAVAGSAFVSWQLGWYEAGLDLQSDDAAQQPVSIVPDPTKHTPLGNATAGIPALILSETSDLYEVLITNPVPHVLAIHRADVTLMYGDSSDRGAAKAHPAGQYLNRNRASTPPPGMFGMNDETKLSAQ